MSKFYQKKKTSQVSVGKGKKRIFIFLITITHLVGGGWLARSFAQDEWGIKFYIILATLTPAGKITLWVELLSATSPQFF